MHTIRHFESPYSLASVLLRKYQLTVYLVRFSKHKMYIGEATIYIIPHVLNHTGIQATRTFPKTISFGLL